MVRPLFDNEFAPLTYSIGFLEAPIDKVVAALEKWRRSHFKSISIEAVADPLPGALLLLEPLSMPRRRELLFSTTSRWTAYFDNGMRGGDPASAIGYLSTCLKCRGLGIKCVPNSLDSEEGTKKGTYGAIQFELFAPESNKEFLNYERTISLANDGGKWVFSANGTAQPFERVENYRNRKTEERFSAELLADYCLALGIRPFDPGYYHPPAYLLKVNDALPSGVREASLKEAQAKIGVTTFTHLRAQR